ncbi:BTAD domain-containing putative transcriptional regulator [Micromonospora sp. NBRC 101691]|uniref:BTAD domain-containing putative transcriptional regulator n=1 Tax=Micromonospora sp. NBRC 101691 TaxID=3032198 RepID=UPI0025549986|nr:BTAD domain-containing putative transcriptional regulator [Micromonospora sp. NBRC 101691]
MFFGILGPVEARTVDGTAVPLGGRQLRALLALLLLEPGRVVGADRLIDGLHGEHPPAGAANALQSQVSRLRRALRAAGTEVTVEAHPAGYRLTVDPEDVDVHRVARLDRAARQALTAGAPARAVALLGEALTFWRGEPLADVTAAPFAAAQVARLTELRLDIVAEYAEAALAAGDPHAPIGLLSEVVAAHPLRERPRGQLMRALHAAGRSAEALRVYADLRRTLAGELGVEPCAELAAVHLAVLRDERGDPVAPPSARLPAQLSSFVGREGDLARVAGLLDAGRLVTVTGPGGVGKTRLAIETAGRRDGEVCFVDLAPLPAGARVAPVLLDAFGLRESGLGLPGVTRAPLAGPPAAPLAGRASADGAGPAGAAAGLAGVGPVGAAAGPVGAGPVDAAAGPVDAGAPAGGADPALNRLVTALSDRRMLLLLDNCEHVVADAAPVVRALLAAGPHLRILATSREPLGLTGELLCPLSPLPVPPPEVPAGTVATAPAVRLFADRAAAVRPDFVLDGDTVDTVRRICAALDGLPLAIELAAVRIRALSLAEVAARLDDRFRLLSRGDRTAAPRHQTLHAVVRWSWDLLSDAERRLLRRLTVFAGGATVSAAEQVCGCGCGCGCRGPLLPLSAEEGSPATTRRGCEPDTAELLAALVDRSLLEHAAGRYRMLETVRSFGAERLAEAGEDDVLRRAHATYVLRLASRADGYLRREEQVDWLHRLRAEHRNLDAALRWAVTADPPLAMRLVGALSAYWYLRGLRGEIAPLAEQVLHVVGPEPPDGLTEEYVLCVMYAVSGGSGAGLADHVRRATVLVDTMEHPPRQPFLHVLWAQFAGPPGAELPRRRRLIGTDPWSQALGHFGNGFLALFQGVVDTAESELRQALTGFRTVGDRWGVSQALDGLATIAAWRGADDECLALRDEALGLVRQLGAYEEVADLHCRRAERLLCVGDPDAARVEYGQAAVLARRGGMSATAAQVAWGLGEVARLTGDLVEARRRQTEALDRVADGWTGGEVRVAVLTALGRVAQAGGDLDEARRRHREALDAALRQHNGPDIAGAAEGLAGVLLDDGMPERAAWLLGVATAVRGLRATPSRDVARVVDGVRATLGADGYAVAFARGAALDHTRGRAVLRDLLRA